MQATEAGTILEKRSFLGVWPPRILLVLGVWPPRILLVLGVLAGIAIWMIPGDDFTSGPRFFSTVALVLVTWLLLVLWLLIFSGYGWRRRLGLVLVPPAVVASVAVALVREVHFDGETLPLFLFRWQTSQEARDKALEENRKLMAAKPPQGPLVLAEGPNDFPEYRGRRRDGILNGPPLARDWSASQPRQLWRQPVGGGYAGFAIAGNVAITIEQRRDREAVVCYDVATGRERWLHDYPALFKEVLGGNGPRATPTIVGDDVYSLGATGMLVCLQGKTGQAKWSVNILENNDNIVWGMSGSPLVVDRVVVVNPGAQRSTAAGHALVAYDRTTGKPVWSAGDARAAYSSPMLATLAGRRQVLLFDAAGLGGYDAATGQELWRYPWQTYSDINVAQPVVVAGDRVFITSGYGHGCALLQIKEAEGKWSATPVWPNTPNRGMRCKFTSPVLYQEALYGLDDGRLVCLDAMTGNQKWKGPSYGHGQLLLVGDLLLILAESGELCLVEANPERHIELGRIQALEGEKTWNPLAVADGKLFVRNHLEMACYELPLLH